VSLKGGLAPYFSSRTEMHCEPMTAARVAVAMEHSAIKKAEATPINPCPLLWLDRVSCSSIEPSHLANDDAALPLCNYAIVLVTQVIVSNGPVKTGLPHSDLSAAHSRGSRLTSAHSQACCGITSGAMATGLAPPEWPLNSLMRWPNLKLQRHLQIGNNMPEEHRRGNVACQLEWRLIPFSPVSTID
jgi:hypothetical protein